MDHDHTDDYCALRDTLAKVLTLPAYVTTDSALVAAVRGLRYEEPYPDQEHRAAWGQDTTAAGPAYEWQTVKVDSANLGRWPPPPKPIDPRSRVDSMCVGTSYPLYHNWVYSEPWCVVKNGACDPLLRERICRHCKRYEYQQRSEAPSPKSEFERLREGLK